MDLHCKHCGEPWDHDCLHEFDDYEKRCKLFAKLGCPALQNEDAELSDDDCLDGKIKAQMTLRKITRKEAEKIVFEKYCIDPIKAAQSAAAIILSEYSDDWII